MWEAPRFILSAHKEKGFTSLEPDVVGHNPSTRELGVVGSIQGYPRLHNEWLSRLGYMKLVSKNTNQRERMGKIETEKDSGRPSFVSN